MLTVKAPRYLCLSDSHRHCQSRNICILFVDDSCYYLDRLLLGVMPSSFLFGSFLVPVQSRDNSYLFVPVGGTCHPHFFTL